MPYLVFTLLVVSLLISAGVNAAMLRFSERFGLVDRRSDALHKRETPTVPNTGGIGIFLGISLPLVATLLAIWLLPVSWWQAWVPGGDALATHLPGLQRSTAIGGGILAALSLLHVLGLVDDRRPLGPYLKLAYQAVVVVFLVLLCDIQILHFLSAFGMWGTIASTIVSVAWVLVIINAMNFLDNMDGLSAGVGATIATLYLGATLIGGQWFVAGVTAMLLGSLLGFLLFNFPPARLFMGDGGSLVLGLMLAVVSVRTTYFDTTGFDGVPGGVAAELAAPAAGQWYGVLMPLMVLAIPLYDFTSVTVLRLLKGQNPMVGDRNHFSHRLVRKGLSTRRAVVLIWMCTLATGIGGIMLGSLNQWQAILAAAQTITVLAVLAMIERGQPDV